MPIPSEDAFLFESVVVGRFAKVTAIDPVTGQEASIVGDPRTPRETLTKLAARKLSKMLAETP